ncbi:hypothetical protein GCK72_003841 [Caenorhabditis remanei]|uniref:Uncharacterized protein n=1 Tax=Caenorhabditis remanei TaxID=31234 RepID=A0A6A5H9N1_CAERE|nr:hypothetical protein GCK72_003841 [Caenorhabditis remanei]KAF1763895.1 hypothetical protein GCK72_003841 [Caenorhabditis remanei]
MEFEDGICMKDMFYETETMISLTAKFHLFPDTFQNATFMIINEDVTNEPFRIPAESNKLVEHSEREKYLKITSIKLTLRPGVYNVFCVISDMYRGLGARLIVRPKIEIYTAFNRCFALQWNRMLIRNVPLNARLEVTVSETHARRLGEIDGYIVYDIFPETAGGKMVTLRIDGRFLSSNPHNVLVDDYDPLQVHNEWVLAPWQSADLDSD